jgi:glycosyltransferase involved in cell wall biosynthesis
MKPLRILYLTDNPNLGASARTLLDWIDIQGTANLRFHLAIARRGPLADWLDERQVPLVASAMPWPDRRNAISCFRALLRVARAARHWGIDIVHAEHNVYPFAALLAKLLRRPVLCHVHYLVDRAYAEWALSGWRRPDHLLWTSRAQMAECAEAVRGVVAEGHQSVIPLGVRLETFGRQAASRDAVRQQWGVSASTRVVGAANAIRPRKRVGDFLHLVDAVTSGRRDTIGVLAGGAPAGDEAYEAEMKALHARLGLDTRLLWVGDLRDVEPFMHAIDVFVSTSEHETFGMSICEAMACGKPVVAYEGGSAGEVVGEGGLVVETGDLSALTRATERLVDEHGLALSLGQAARERVADVFDPRASLRTLATLYASLGQSHRRPVR